MLNRFSIAGFAIYLSAMDYCIFQVDMAQVFMFKLLVPCSEIHSFGLRVRMCKECRVASFRVASFRFASFRFRVSKVGLQVSSSGLQSLTSQNTRRQSSRILASGNLNLGNLAFLHVCISRPEAKKSNFWPISQSTNHILLGPRINHSWFSQWISW